MKPGATTILSLAAVLTTCLCVAVVRMPWAEASWFRMLPYLFFSIGGMLGLLFTQSRITFLCLLHTAILLLLTRDSFVEHNPVRLSATVFLASLYVPTLTVLFYHLNERRLLSFQGFIRLGVMLSVVLVVAFLPQSETLSQAIYDANNALFLPTHMPCLHIPLIGILVFLGSIPFLFAIRKSENLHGTALLPSLLCAFGALNFQSSCWQHPSIALSAFMAVAGLSLIAAVLQSSWYSMNTDELTELPGRRSLRHHLANVSCPYTLAVIDIDFFKKINDKHGHGTGDEVLRYVASQLRRIASGRAYRYGGEEFVIVIEDGKDFKTQVEAMEVLRKNISGRDFWIRGRDRPRQRPEQIPATVKHKTNPRITVTVSIGVAHSHEKYATPTDVFDAADRAMYRAKQDGRDRVKVAR